MTAISASRISIPDGPALEGTVIVPERAFGVVLFAHGSGSGHASPRNVWVAERLADSRLASVLFDLLSPDEAADRANVFDVPLLASRLGAATDHALAIAELAALPMGYFGASTGAAAALWAAAERGDAVRAVVSRGGRPDLAAERLPAVSCPTVLIVGALDEQVIGLNEQARAMLACESELQIVPGAGHLFEEPGALETVAWIAASWFHRHLGRQAAR